MYLKSLFYRDCVSLLSLSLSLFTRQSFWLIYKDISLLMIFYTLFYWRVFTMQTKTSVHCVCTNNYMSFFAFTCITYQFMFCLHFIGYPMSHDPEIYQFNFICIFEQHFIAKNSGWFLLYFLSRILVCVLLHLKHDPEFQCQFIHHDVSLKC